MCTFFICKCKFFCNSFCAVTVCIGYIAIQNIISGRNIIRKLEFAVASGYCRTELICTVCTVRTVPVIAYAFTVNRIGAYKLVIVLLFLRSVCIENRSVCVVTLCNLVETVCIRLYLNGIGYNISALYCKSIISVVCNRKLGIADHAPPAVIGLDYAC